MERELSHFKNDILESCKKIAEFINGYDLEKFHKDEKTYYAVLMQLAMIGEAASHFPEDIRSKNTEIEWRDIVALRNFLIHEYFKINPKSVWKAASEDVQNLARSLENLNL